MMSTREYCRKYVRIKGPDGVSRGFTSWELYMIEHLSYGEFQITKTRYGDRIIPMSKARFKKARARAYENIIWPPMFEETGKFPVAISDAHPAPPQLQHPISYRTQTQISRDQVLMYLLEKGIITMKENIEYLSDESLSIEKLYEKYSKYLQ